MNKYFSPKAELVEFSIQDVILASVCPLDISGCGLDDGTNPASQSEGQTMDTQSLV